VADIVVDLLDRRPIWAFPAWGEAALRDALPRGWTLHMATRAADGSGDGVTGVEGLPADLVDALGDARAYLGFRSQRPLILAAAPDLAGSIPERPA
jgi:hypothetical protein